MANTVEATIEIPFPSKEVATIAYNVLKVDEEPPRSQVTKKLSQEENILKVVFHAKLAKHVRVACTSFFDSLNLIIDTINFTGLPQHSGYSYP
ncbi:uncharacterized protein Tcs6 [Atheta coriaria]|uniref:uncharacterized protein Tcs6 n=1 Tax=Dalotia coriaria TaxID=877792 RepID=UPI0031F39211